MGLLPPRTVGGGILATWNTRSLLGSVKDKSKQSVKVKYINNLRKQGGVVLLQETRMTQEAISSLCHHHRWPLDAFAADPTGDYAGGWGHTGSAV